jgi:hypothetical protein
LTLGTLLRRCAALLSAAAGVIHLAAAGDHTEHAWAAAFFVVAGCLQIAWAGAVVSRPSPRWLLAGAAGSLVIVGLWLLSRTAGVPVVLGGEGAEPFGVADTVASLLELAVAGAAGLTAVLPGVAADAAFDRRAGERATAVAGGVALLLLVPALVTTPAGHHGDGTGHTALAGHAEGGHVHTAAEHPVTAAAAHGHGHGSEVAVAGGQHAHTGTGSSAAAAGHGHGAGAAAVHGPHQGASHVEHGPGAALHAHDGAACQPTAQEQAEADRLLAATTRTLTRYDNHNNALRDGFVPFPPVPADWSQHYVDFAALDDEHILDPEHPESLLYAITDKGYRPISALFILSHAGDEPPDTGGCLLHWHKHDELFLSRPGEQGSPLMLHVFTVPMEGGPFAHEPDPRSVRALWQPFRDHINPWYADSCFGLPLLPGDPLGMLCESDDH